MHKKHGLRGLCALFAPVILRGSNPDVCVTGRGEFRSWQGLLTSQNHESILGAGSAPATNMRQNQSQVDGRTHTTNSPHQTPGQHRMSARPMSAHFLHDLHLCFTGFGGLAPVLGEGLARL